MSELDKEKVNTVNNLNKKIKKGKKQKYLKDEEFKPKLYDSTIERTFDESTGGWFNTVIG